MAMLLPPPSVAVKPESVICDEVFVVVGEILNVATATVPFGTSTLLDPVLTIRQLALPAAAGHASTSPETEDTVEVCATLTALKSADEYFRVHCAPVGFALPDANEIFTATLEPGAPDPPDNDSTGWADAPPTTVRKQITATLIQISPQKIRLADVIDVAGPIGTTRGKPTAAER